MNMNFRLILHAFFLFLLISPTLISCQGHEVETKVIAARGGLAIRVKEPLEIRILRQGRESFRWTSQDPNGLTRLARDLFLAEMVWNPGDRLAGVVVTSKKRTNFSLTGPQKPSPVLVARLELENVPLSNGESGTHPNTVIRFSPDRRYLAAGSQEGWLRILDLWTNRLIEQRRIPEGLVKRIAWGSRQGKAVLYIGEQSPEGFVYCFSIPEGHELWKYALEPEVRVSAQGADPVFLDIYRHPGSYYLKALENGDVVVLVTRDFIKEGRQVYRSRVLRLDGRTGRPQWKWPDQTAIPYGCTWLGISRSGRRIVALASTRTEPAEEDPVLPNCALYCLDGDSGRLLWTFPIPPLEPYYQRVGSWRGVSMSPDGRHAAVGLYDGRVMLFDVDGPVTKNGILPQNKPRWIDPTGTPVMVGGIPVAAQASYTALTDRNLWVGLSSTNVPASVTRQQRRVPAPHPFQGCLLAFDLEGNPIWQWRTPACPQGLALSGDQRWLAAGITENKGLSDMENFGLTLFDLAPGLRPRNRFVFHYPSNGPALYSLDMSADGQLTAFVEVPLTLDEGKTVYGRYQVLVVH